MPAGTTNVEVRRLAMDVANCFVEALTLTPALPAMIATCSRCGWLTSPPPCSASTGWG